MRFKINNHTWRIIECDTQEINKRFCGLDDEFLYGFCSYTENIIYLNNTLVRERKETVLMHELMHCWTMENGYGFNNEHSREDLCNICAASHDFIHKTITTYFKHTR